MKLLITGTYKIKLKPLTYSDPKQFLIAFNSISQYCVKSIKNDNNI